tara:strand:+ start:211 stop:444 length:234 start_codon:yes stop_codon:yes gene_type:complete
MEFGRLSYGLQLAQRNRRAARERRTGRMSKFPTSPPIKVKHESLPKETVGMNSLVVNARKPTTRASVEKIIARPAVW